MKKEEIRKYQLSQIELLEETDRICKELNIYYYLIGGTLLGAVRHDGFIPWDADIDIAMRREHYEKFREYWKIANSDRYFYAHYSTETNHLSPHALLRIKDTHIKFSTRKTIYNPKNDGIYMDIFPLDEPPMDKNLQKKQMKRIKNIKKIIEFKIGYVYTSTGKLKLLVKKLIQFCLLPFSLPMIYNCLDNTMKKYSGSNSGYLVSMASHYSYWKQLMTEDIYGKPVRVNFEGYDFCAPAETDKYLKQIYGDYMKLPPEEKRFSDLNSIECIDYGKESKGYND